MEIKEKENINAKTLPEVYYCKHMLSGICSYEDERVYVDTETMKKMNKSFAGKPVYVQHQAVNLDTLELDMDGVVSESFYNELDGCLWAKFIVTTDKAKDVIRQGYSVSNAYTVDSFGSSGLHNNTEYNREILGGTFNHLAIVDNPRYEKAKIYTPEEFKEYQRLKKAELEELTNSKKTVEINNNKKGKTMKFFKTKKEEVSELDLDTSIELENGVEISLQEMINAVSKNSEEKKEGKEEKEKINEDMEIEVGEEKMPLKELINKYMNMCKDKENEAEEEKKEKENMEEKEKENSKHVETLVNAASEVKAAAVELPQHKYDRGTNLYGSSKK